MNLIKEIFANEVFPAVGCTEPISCAYTCAVAASFLGATVEKIELSVDPGTFKNGAAVYIPNSGGLKGNVIAAALGALISRPELNLEILKSVTPKILEHARDLVNSGAVKYHCKDDEKEFRIEALVEGGGDRVKCVVSGGHTNVSLLEKNGISQIESLSEIKNSVSDCHRYREMMRTMKLEDLLREVVQLDVESRAYIQLGIDMNLAIAEKGVDLRRNAYQLQQMMKKGFMADDLFYRVKQKVASALDARMGGLAEPVMTSGGSGNQGILTILLPYLVGRDQNIPLSRIQESIAVSHAVNSYIKSFTGELSVVCGCAIAASIAAAIAIVYQKNDIDIKSMTYAIDNIIADLCGIICDGAKSGCSMKIVTGADSALRASFMALSGYGISSDDGVIGGSAEESIRNLSRISLEGMGLVDKTVVQILKGKTIPHGHA